MTKNKKRGVQKVVQQALEGAGALKILEMGGRMMGEVPEVLIQRKAKVAKLKPRKKKGPNPSLGMVLSSAPRQQLGVKRGPRKMVLQHDEFVSDILGSEDFAIFNTYSLNPGLPSVLPWASGIAQRYEEFSVKNWEFYYKPTSGEVVSGTNPALGYVLLGVQYNPYDAIFASKQKMLDYDGVVEGLPSKPLGIRVNTKSSKKLYVRNSDATIATGPDLRFDDLGYLTVAVGGQPASGNIIGELHCRYTFEFITPNDDISGAPGDYMHFYNATGVATATPLGTPANSVITGNLRAFQGSYTSIQWGTLNGSPDILDLGYYVVSVLWSFASSTVTLQMPAPVFEGAVMVSILDGGAANFATAPDTGSLANNNSVMMFVIQVTSTANVVMDFGATGTIGSSAKVDVLLTRIATAGVAPLMRRMVWQGKSRVIKQDEEKRDESLDPILV